MIYVAPFYFLSCYSPSPSRCDFRYKGGDAVCELHSSRAVPWKVQNTTWKPQRSRTGHVKDMWVLSFRACRSNLYCCLKKSFHTLMCNFGLPPVYYFQSLNVLRLHRFVEVPVPPAPGVSGSGLPQRPRRGLCLSLPQLHPNGGCGGFPSSSK